MSYTVLLMKVRNSDLVQITPRFENASKDAMSGMCILMVRITR
ncbi:hypothetical protein AF72_02305 [Xylella taiwanensis]|uniref:Uncharacterized protein n=1 Tax=Xylella taiwanensis TaxID=1444770 RepID=Z9JMX0_9GAMM|nr:hypothetical protein AF72_02305 [Xylella taiwanensis]